MRCSKMCEPFRTAGVALPEDEILPIDPSQQWAPIEWDNRRGTVTLAGDAAHSMLPRKSPIIVSSNLMLMGNTARSWPRFE